MQSFVSFIIWNFIPLRSVKKRCSFLKSNVISRRVHVQLNARVCEPAPSACPVLRVRGMGGASPQARQVLRDLRLCQSMSATSVRLGKAEDCGTVCCVGVPRPEVGKQTDLQEWLWQHQQTVKCPDRHHRDRLSSW